MQGVHAVPPEWAVACMVLVALMLGGTACAFAACWCLSSLAQHLYLRHKVPTWRKALQSCKTKTP
jgi:hypothetical protein